MSVLRLFVLFVATFVVQSLDDHDPVHLEGTVETNAISPTLFAEDAVETSAISPTLVAEDAVETSAISPTLLALVGPSPYKVCNPFGVMAQGLLTCAEYFGRFSKINCNYNLLNHNVCDGTNPDESKYIQIRHLCPVECANVEIEEDSLDDSISYPIDGFEDDDHRRRLLTEERRNSGGFHTSMPEEVVAYVYEHHGGRGRSWSIRARGSDCCRRRGWGMYCWWGLCWSNKCDGSCRSAERVLHAWAGHNDMISSVTVGANRELILYKHASADSLFSYPEIFNENRGCKCGLKNFELGWHENDQASSYFAARNINDDGDGPRCWCNSKNENVWKYQHGR